MVSRPIPFRAAADRRRFLDPLAALEGAIERLRTELPGRSERLDDDRRARVELAAGDVLRAVVGARRATRALELAGIAALDQAAGMLGAALLERLYDGIGAVR